MADSQQPVGVEIGSLSSQASEMVILSIESRISKIKEYVDIQIANLREMDRVTTKGLSDNLAQNFETLREGLRIVTEEYRKDYALSYKNIDELETKYQSACQKLEKVSVSLEDLRKAFDIVSSKVDQSVVDIAAFKTYVAEHEAAFALYKSDMENRLKVLREQSDDRLLAARNESGLIFAASEKAISKSEASYDKRLEALSTSIERITAEVRLNMPREVADALIADLRRSLDSRIAEVKSQIVQLQQRQDQTDTSASGISKNMAYMIAILGIVLTIVIFTVNFLLAG